VDLICDVLVMEMFRVESCKM